MSDNLDLLDELVCRFLGHALFRNDVAARSSQDFACCARAIESALLEIGLRFRHIVFRRVDRDFAGDATDLRLEPLFLLFPPHSSPRQCSAKRNAQIR